jgi:putative SOS response-associated peptidase YedK
MCGRYAYLLNWDEVWNFPDPFRGPELPPRRSYNVAPKATVPVIRADENGPLIREMQWWFVPRWSKTADIKYATFNAKSEEAAGKPAFRDSFRHRRCVIPASGYYEWKKLDARNKQPYFITRTDGAPLYMAGLWDLWNGELETCTVLTTTPNAEMRDIHTRMPCILEPGQLPTWLDLKLTDPEQIQKLLSPPPDGLLSIKPVSNRVGNVRNNDASLIEGIEPQGLW